MVMNINCNRICRENLDAGKPLLHHARLDSLDLYIDVNTTNVPTRNDHTIDNIDGILVFVQKYKCYIHLDAAVAVFACEGDEARFGRRRR